MSYSNNERESRNSDRRSLRIYYWIHHTGRYNGNTGVQRVVRALGSALLAVPELELVPVRWCAERESIVRAEQAWVTGLSRYGGPALAKPAEAGTPLHLVRDDAPRMREAWLLIGEVPHLGGGAPEAPGPALPVALDYARYHGLRSAIIFYDLIPLRVPGYEDAAAAHAAYATALAAADLILPISRSSGTDLATWWREQEQDPDRLSTLRPLLLPAEMVGVPRVTVTDTPATEAGREEPGEVTPVRFLSLGTIEPRKNQLVLLKALNRLRQRRPELAVELDVVGALHPAVATDVLEEAARSGGAIRLHHDLSDAVLLTLTRNCAATVFLSLAEGFGLPIAESLWLGKPSLCSDVGSMAEIAAAGGCLMVDPRDPVAIERGLERLADDAELRAELTRAARSRPLIGWNDYARAVLAEFDAAPPVPLLVLIEGTRGGGEAFATVLEAASTRVWRHHWRAESQAILPGFRSSGEPSLGIGRGDLRGSWAVLPLVTTNGIAEAMRIHDEARGLGLRLVVTIQADRRVGDTELMLLSRVDLALFATVSERDAALDYALRTLPRTACLRQRFGVANVTREILTSIAAERPRIAAGGMPRAPERVFYWTGLTITQPFNTGIQRVTRSLGRALCDLGVQAVPVKWDGAAGRMATLEPNELAMLARWGGPSLSVSQLPDNLSGEWLLIPEVVVPAVPSGSNPARLAQGLGMRVAAIFYDLMPLKMESFYPPGTVTAFSHYWDLFSEADVALPISWTVAADLRRYLSGRGLRVPRITPCQLAGDLPETSRGRSPGSTCSPGSPLRLLAIGTLEPRKNYPRLLRALIEARRLVPTRPIQLTIVGRRAGYATFEADINRLKDDAGGVQLLDHVPDEELLALFGQSDATVYGSWEEGFGLPVLESLWRGRPCLCHNGSALAEIAPGGGVLAVDMLDEAAIAYGIARLSNEDGLLDRLRHEAVTRPIRSWEDYARDVLLAMARAGTAPGWPLPAVLTGAPRPLLSCCITTYNRARWLRHSLPRLIEAARPYRDRVEVVVCDNASTDATPEVVAQFAGTPGFLSCRNPVNVGMLGNLGATARASNGAYLWLIGDDDLILDGAIKSVMTGLETHPDVEMAYMNYAYTRFDAPDQLSDIEEIVRAAKPIGYGGPDRRVSALRDVAALNENLFTAIYACAFRRDHALRAYQQDTTGAPFSSLLTCVPSSVYAIAALQDRPVWWVGQPALVINMNVSWLRWALLWHLERMPDLYDAAELAGIDPVRVDRHRVKHCTNAGEWARMALMEAEDSIRQGFSMGRLIERCKHIEAFSAQLPKLREAYAQAWSVQRVVADRLDPDALFSSFGSGV